MGKIIGIDLGTTNSCVAIMDGGKARVIENSEGDRTTPSIVAYTKDGEVLVGASAKRQAVTNPKNTFYAVKRLIGRKFTDAEVQKDIAHVPYSILAHDNGDAWVATSDGKKMAPQEISAKVLEKMKKTAEDFLGEKVTEAVITVPAYFNYSQRQATKDAGLIAGLDVKRIINEPTAASLAYGLQQKMQGTIAVYDLGGGTFDISILKLKNGIFEVLATNCDTHLGGDDFDRRVANLILKEVRDQYGLDREQYPDTMQSVRLEAERAKIRLSDDQKTTIAIELPARKGEYRRELTRDQLEALTMDLVEQTIGPCRLALKDAGLQPSELDEVVLVGGATRMPLVRRRVQELFGKVPHSEINPDEVVALGAAVQADILSGGTQDMLLLDVTPLSLGIETMGGVTSMLIRRNTTIPASAKEMFTTYVDGQTSVDIHVLQGERELAKDNRSLARFQLRVPPLPAGVPRVEVMFLIDANGILNVSAKDVRTGQIQSIEVKPSSGLTDEEVERMITESFKFASDDLKARQLIEARTEAEAIVKATEKAFTLGGHLIGAEETALIKASLGRLQTATSSDDHRGIRARIADVEKATHHLAEVLMDSTLKEALQGKKLSELP